MIDVPSRIIELRKQKGYTTTHLAKLSDIGQSTLSEIERGTKNPTVITLEHICKGLGITLVDFFNIDNKPDILSSDLRFLLEYARTLSSEQISLLVQLLKSFNKNELG